jgi:quinol-cytochrome oxidoreductase complex cytochrome b subunit
MIVFDRPITRAIGVALLVAFIVLGVWAVASPRALERPEEEERAP